MMIPASIAAIAENIFNVAIARMIYHRLLKSAEPPQPTAKPNTSTSMVIVVIHCIKHRMIGLTWITAPLGRPIFRDSGGKGCFR
jgi:hypothetical protein